jgi:hypothetical protein
MEEMAQMMVNFIDQLVHASHDLVKLLSMKMMVQSPNFQINTLNFISIKLQYSPCLGITNNLLIHISLCELFQFMRT